MFIIPAIDIYKNKTVRLLKGNFNEVTYYPLSPLEQAKYFESLGFKRIHIVDLQGSAEGVINVLEILQLIKEETFLEIEFGGGIRDIDTVELLLKTGIDKIIIGSLAVKQKQLFESIVKTYTPESFIIAADVKDKLIAVQGWKDISSVSLFEHIKYCKSLGLNEFICTDISKDGTLQGANVTLYNEILNEFTGINLIASGGIKDIRDIDQLRKINVYAAIVGKAIYENSISIEELKKIAG